MEEEKVKVLRAVASYVLEFIGIWLIVGTWFFSQGGPRFLSLEMSMASAAAIGWLVFRGGWALR